MSDGRWEIYQVQKEKFEPVAEVPPRSRVIIDNSQSVNRIVRQVLNTVNVGVDND